MNAPEVASLLNGRNTPGVRFAVDSFAPVSPGDGKYGGRLIPGIRLLITDRNAVRSGHLCAAILWALLRANRDSLRVRDATFDERFGSPAMREALFSGEDPDRVVDRGQRAVDDFATAARRFLLYR
jgi:uncharacterized protein YbbC (DUF1343 family)